MSIKITAIANLHGCYPNNLPEADLLFILGNIHHNYGNIKYEDKLITQSLEAMAFFQPWLKKQLYKFDRICLIPGNQDHLFDAANNDAIPDYLKCFNSELDLPKYRIIPMVDKLYQYKDYKIFGSPWTIGNNYMAFSISEEEISKKWKQIPQGVDILLTTEQPQYFNSIKQGSSSLMVRIANLPKLKMHLFGNYHTYGIEKFHNKILANVSISNLEGMKYTQTKQYFHWELRDV